MNKTVVLLLAVFGLLCVQAWGQASGYQIADLAEEAGEWSWLYAINNPGEVVGDYESALGESASFTWGPISGRHVFPTDNPLFEARDINDLGQVAGIGDEDPSVVGMHVYCWDSVSGFTDLGLPWSGPWWAGIVYVQGINNEGQITGCSPRRVDAPYPPWLKGFDGFVRDPGSGFRYLDRLPASAPPYWREDYDPLAINNVGQVAGRGTAWTTPTASVTFPCFWDSDGTPQKLCTLPGDVTAWAYGLNDVGQVVGVSKDATGFTRAFVWDAALGMRRLGPEGLESYAYSINGFGQAVGSVCTAGGVWKACLWDPVAGLVYLDMLDPTGYAEAFDINDHGVICGYCSTPEGTEHAVIWTPTPETATEQLSMIIAVAPDNPAIGIAPELQAPLLSKVDAALAALETGNPNAAKVAVNDLKALVNQVKAQTDKKIAPDVAAEIIERANRIIAALGG